jgi:hypothetical protein
MTLNKLLSLFGFLSLLIFNFTIAWAAAPTVPTMTFDHKAHLKDHGADTCQACHDSAAASLMPTHKNCGECHDDLPAAGVKVGKDGKTEACMMCHTDKNFKIVRTRDFLNHRLWNAIDANFQHTGKTHAKSDCTTCHKNIKTSTKTADNNYPQRSDCGKCHQGAYWGEPHSCVLCHALHRPHHYRW